MKWRNAALSGLGGIFLALPALAENTPPEQGETTVVALATRAENIKTVHLEASRCRTQIGNALLAADMVIGGTGEPVDVILEVELTPLAGWMTETPLIGTFLGGFATRATYEAKVIGKGDQVLLSLHGEERAITGREMCQDIGDNLAERLSRRGDEDD